MEDLHEPPARYDRFAEPPAWEQLFITFFVVACGTALIVAL